MARRGKVNPDQMNVGTSLVSDIYTNMAQELMLRLIHRLKRRGAWDLQQNPYAWQLEKLNDMHMLNAENVKFIAQQSGIAEKQLRAVIQNEGLKVYESTADQLAEETGAKVPPLNGVQETLQAYAQQTFRELDNYVNQTLLSTNLGENGAMRAYKSMVEQTTAEVVTGLKSPDMAIRDTVMKWVDKGIPSAFVDKGGNTWSLDRYARTVITSTSFCVFNEMRTRAGEDFGIETFYMSAHPAARPACAPIQGHVVTKAKQGFESGDQSVGYVASLYDHGYGGAGGTMGVNCHHYLTPFVIGVNELPDDDVPDPDQAVANGELQARQRAYEREIRANKYRAAAAKELGDEALTKHYNGRVRELQGGLARLINDNGFLHRDYTRERAIEDAAEKQKARTIATLAAARNAKIRQKLEARIRKRKADEQFKKKFDAFSQKYQETFDKSSSITQKDFAELVSHDAERIRAAAAKYPELAQRLGVKKAKQNEHIPGTKERADRLKKATSSTSESKRRGANASYFTLSATALEDTVLSHLDVEKAFQKYQYVPLQEDVGIMKDMKGHRVHTDSVKVHQSQDGWHAVPSQPEGWSVDNGPIRL